MCDPACSMLRQVDVYRTLADLAGLASDVQADVQGTSLLPLFVDPAHPPTNLATKPAFSQIARCHCGTYTCWAPTSCDHTWNASWYDPHGGTRGCNAQPGTASNRTCFACRPKRNAPPPPPQCGWSGTECGANACSSVPQSQFDYMGYSMRTATRRFTAWTVWDNTRNATDWSQPVMYELFDLTDDDGTSFDFDGYARNVATIAPYSSEIASLRSQLQDAVESWR